MEPDMVVEMVTKCHEKGVPVKTIIADDDTTTISRLRQTVDPNKKKV